MDAKWFILGKAEQIVDQVVGWSNNHNIFFPKNFLN